MTFKFLSKTAVVPTLRLAIAATLTCQSYGKAHADQPTAELRLSLEECLTQAPEKSLAIETEKNNLLASRLRVKNNERDWLPDLLVGASYKYEEEREDHQAGELFPYFSLSQVIFNDERSYAARLNAVTRLAQSEEQLETGLKQLYGNIIKEYFALLQSQAQLELESRFFEQRRTEYTNAQIRSRDGLISAIELMKKESMFELAKAELAVSRNRAESVEFELSTLLNLDSKTRIVATDIFSPVFYAVSFDSCRRYAEKHNPILQLNRRFLKDLPEFRQLAKRTSWPTVSLSAYFGSGATEWDNENRYGLTINATKPLYDFGKTERKQQILSLELDSLEKSISEKERTFFTDLHSLHTQFTASGNLIRTSQYRKDLADRLEKASEKSFELGIISQEKLQESRNGKKEREKDVQAAINRYLVAEMLLKLGCGVSDKAVLLKPGPDWLQATVFPGQDIDNSNRAGPK